MRVSATIIAGAAALTLLAGASYLIDIDPTQSSRLPDITVDVQNAGM